VVKADGSRARGCGFEPRHRILDGFKRCLLLHKPENNENTDSEWGTPKKKKKKKKNSSKYCIL
jgi:hypothetical protein